MNNIELETLITRSQHCQRNWDLSKAIPHADIETLKVAVKECPSKQNRVFYKALFIQDRSTIELFYLTTESYTLRFHPEHIATYNDQTLANLLVVFVRDRDYTENVRVEYEHDNGIKKKDDVGDSRVRQDEDRALGVAGGYVTLVAHMLGYKTGFYNGQKNKAQSKELLGEDVLMAVGIGFNDTSKHYRDSHDNVFDGEDGLSRFFQFKKNIVIKDI